MKKIFINGLGVLAALGVMTGVAGCGGEGTGAKKTDATATADSVTTVTVKTSTAVREEVERSAVFTSDIEAWQQNNIASNAQGMRIAKILVDVGARVQKGQLLATIDPAMNNTTAVQLANAEADYARLKRVFDAGGISKQQMDQAETALEVQRTNAKSVLDNTELRSPIGGVVTARNYDAGDFPGQLPIFTVMQIDRLKVTLSISEQYFPLVRKGMEADIDVDMYPGKSYPGEVSLIYPAIDPATRTFTIEVAVPNPTGELRPGMFSRTRLVFGSSEGVMVDDVAVQKQMGTNDKFVFVARDGVARRRMVVTGVQKGNRIEIVSGVEAGEEMVVAGIPRLMDGSRIEVKNE